MKDIEVKIISRTKRCLIHGTYVLLWTMRIPTSVRVLRFKQDKINDEAMESFVIKITLGALTHRQKCVLSILKIISHLRQAEFLWRYIHVCRGT